MTSGGPSLANWLVVVPARLASTRLPEKPLADLGGRPMIVRSVENLAPLARRGAQVVVATDSKAVKTAVEAHGFTALMTREDHQSGTDRCWEIAAGAVQPFVLNVQGDEPFANINDLTALMTALEKDPAADLGTLVFHCRDQALAKDPNVVKAVRSTSGTALYFSRSAVPYWRDNAATNGLPESFWQHLGVYAFRREKLQAFVALPQSPLELAEKLEQLRALDHGWRILLAEAKTFSRGIDTPHDLEAARARYS